MPNYIEYIKAGTGEAWPVRDKDAQDKLTNLVDLVYPIGSIYMSVVATSPADLFGGSWERIQDRFLLAASDVYDAGSTGGESTHTLTIDEMPDHGHRTWYYNTSSSATGPGGYVDGETKTGKLSGTTDPASSYIDHTGGGQPHNNMPPYLAVYMWRRTN